MKMPLSTFFERMEAAYRVGDYNAVAKCFVLPGAVYIGDEVIVLPSFAVLRGMLKDQRRLNHGLGIRYSSPLLVGQSYCRKNNYSVWVYWRHFDEQGEVANSYNTRYVCRDNAEGEPRIQLVEFLSVPMCLSKEKKVRLLPARLSLT